MITLLNIPSVTILLDIDGVLVTTPPWKKVDLLDDGFMAFNPTATHLLQKLYEITNAAIVLTTSHRINYSIGQWKQIFHSRGLCFDDISKINDVSEIQNLGIRADEINAWVSEHGHCENYVIIDDDLSIMSLSNDIRSRTVITSLMIGINNVVYATVLKILNYENKH